MKSSKQITLVFLSVLLAFVLITVGYYLIRNRTKETSAIIIPELSAQAQSGQSTFRIHCIECHGENAAGTDKGPSLLTRIYAPSHHSDVSFVRAVTLGARQHHWLFGNMPPLPQVRLEEIELITIYVRELQKANGIS